MGRIGRDKKPLKASNMTMPFDTIHLQMETHGRAGLDGRTDGKPFWAGSAFIHDKAGYGASLTDRNKGQDQAHGRTGDGDPKMVFVGHKISTFNDTRKKWHRRPLRRRATFHLNIHIRACTTCFVCLNEIFGGWPHSATARTVSRPYLRFETG